MKTTIRYTKKALTLLLTLLLILASFTACNKKVDDSTSVPDKTSSTETVTSSEDDSKNEDTTSEDSTPSSSESAPSSSQTSTPTASSKPAPVESSKPESKPEPKPESKPESTPEPVVPEKKTPQELIIGKWQGNYDVGPDFEQLGYNIEDETIIKTQMEYTTSGTVIVTIDMAALKRIMRPMLQQSIDETCQLEMQEKGITKEEWEAQFLAENGMGVSEYIDYILDLFSNDFNYVSEYKFASDTLLIKDTINGQFVECAYRFNNDNTFVAIDENVETVYSRVA